MVMLVLYILIAENNLSSTFDVRCIKNYLSYKWPKVNIFLLECYVALEWSAISGENMCHYQRKHSGKLTWSIQFYILNVKRQNINPGPHLITRTIIRMCCVIMLAGCCGRGEGGGVVTSSDHHLVPVFTRWLSRIVRRPRWPLEGQTCRPGLTMVGMKSTIALSHFQNVFRHDYK